MKLDCNSFFDGDFEYLNLNQFYLDNKDKIADTKKPEQIQTVLNSLDKNTYGGYGEDRKDIWKGTYMDKTEKYIHLGIDINIKAGTKIKCPFTMWTIDTFLDSDTKIGWGGRIILQSPPYSKRPYLVLAHIAPKSLWDDRFLLANEFYGKGSTIGEVGTWPTNGNTFQHLHVQAVYDLDIMNFDGYGSIEDLKNNPNPFEIDW